MNKKEIKNILKLIKEQWGCDIKLDYAFLMNKENKIYIVNKEISNVDFSKLRINSIGLYFATMQGNELRLSIEGSQIIGPKAKKNVVELGDEETKQWLKGTDLEKSQKSKISGKLETSSKSPTETKEKGFVIIKHKEDFLGCGKAVEKKVLNYVPKARRIAVNN